jgi:DNA polymerase III subunit epsilon
VTLLSKPLKEVDYCILDLETTGLSPDTDGIVEIAMIRIDGHGNILDKFHSLINPLQSVKCTKIHGITDSDVANAPKIFDVAGHITRIMSEAILVAYNAYFDLSFLREKLFAPLDISQRHPYFCCMYMRGLIGLEPTRTDLCNACNLAGINIENEHQAFYDAQYTQKLFTHYLAIAEETGLKNFSDLKRQGKNYQFMKSWEFPLPLYSWKNLPSSSPKPRPIEIKESITTQAQKLSFKVDGSSRSVTFVGNLIKRIWDSVRTVKREGQEEYFACLTDALADRILQPREIDELRSVAWHYGLDKNEIQEIHNEFYQSVWDEAMKDGIITNEEKDDLEELVKLLGIEGTSSYELTEEEKKILDRHHEFYRSLEAGARLPRTEAQRHFVAMCHGKVEAETFHEKIYAKHLRIRGKHRHGTKSDSNQEKAYRIV